MPSLTINAPQFLHLDVTATPERPSVKIRTIHDPRRGVYVTASLALDHPAVAITPTLLAKMRLGSIRRDALRAAIGTANAELNVHAAIKTYFKGTSGRAVAEKVRAEPSDAHLEIAAVIHRLARLIGDYPVQAVARSFGLEQADAQRWVKLARKVGELR